MNKNVKALIAVVAFLSVLVWSFAIGAEDIKKGDKGQSLAKTSGKPDFQILNINNYTSWVRSDNSGNLSPHGDNQGIFPRGTSGNVIYTDGIVWGAKAFTDAAKTTPAPRQAVRVGGKAYGFGQKAGRITGSGAAAVAVNPNDADVRIFRVRRDYASMSDDELRRDAAESNEIPIGEVTDAQVAKIKKQYDDDWREWPVANGAPYIDRNGNGIYNAPPAFSATFTVDSLIAQKRDEPGVAGADPNSPADQVIWTVANDLDVSQTLAFLGSEPVGLEVQYTIWGYKRTDALGNLYFKRVRLINKGGVEVNAATPPAKGSFYLDSIYVCQWSDIDLGNAGDDLAGCDSTLSMGFVYNGFAIDNTYQKNGLPPPASGYDFLAGPIVPSPGDSAVFNLKRRYNVKNLGMSSFAYFSAGSPYSDPPNGLTGGYTNTSGQWWKLLRGYAPLGGFNTVDQPFASGTFATSKFPLSGDPTTGKGFLDGLGFQGSFAPGDRRILLNTGPFTMAPGDTQEIVVGTVAGLGADRVSSVAVMKFNDRFVQNTFDALFQVPRAPVPPNIKVVELDGEVVLEWGSDLQRVSDTETKVSQPGGYTFEGYNVYQLPKRNSRLSEAKRIKTFDLTTDPTVILDLQFDEKSGQILSIPVHFGSNSGIQRYFDFKRDYIKDIDKIYNGQEYYIAVTAYSKATEPGYLPAALESAPLVLTVRAKVPFGQSPYVKPGTGLAFSHSVGIGDVSIIPTVVDPMKVTGQTYTIGWSKQPDGFSGEQPVVEDADGNIVSDLTISGVLNEAATSFAYNVGLSNTVSLAGPLVALEFIDGSSGPAVFNIPYAIDPSTKAARGSGSWTLTAQLAQRLIGGNITLRVRTTVDTAIAAITWDTYPYYIQRGTSTIFTFQRNISLDESYPIFDGLQVKVGAPVFKLPQTYTWKQTAGTGDAAHFYTDFGYLYSDLFPQSSNNTTATDMVTNLEFRFTGVRIAEKRPDGSAVADTVIIAGGSIATVASQNAASIVRIRIPFELWEVDPGTGRNRQINVVVRDRNADGKSPWGSGGKPLYIRMSTTGARAYIGAVSTPYNSDTSAAGITAVPRDNPKGTWVFATAVTSGTTPTWKTGDVVHISIPNPTTPGTDVYTLTAPTPVVADQSKAKLDANTVGVYPNPYYAFNPAETNRFNRYVTFNNLPQRAKFRIFNLAGQMVRVIDKDDATQFLRWDLFNANNIPVASGVYVVHIEMPDVGVTKILKVAIIQEQEVLDTY